VAVSLLAAAAAAGAQPTDKVYRVGYLATGAANSNPHLAQAFRDGLRELGWVEGQNLVIDYRFAENRRDRLPDLAAELVRNKVDVIVAPGGTPPVVAAREATRTIPIVMMGVGDPVSLGLITSLARPGGNITGLSFGVGFETAGKSLELLKEAVPKVHRVAILSNPTNPSHAPSIDNVKAVARSLSVQLHLFEARAPDQLDNAFTSMVRKRVEALLVVPDSLFILNRGRLADLAARRRLPAIYGYREHVESQGLMSYGPSMSDLFRRTATYVDKILRGAAPAVLPVEQPSKFELIINVKAAKALGLTIPPALLLRADQVLE
jgi:putative ABC transport system substrate-binding protein